MPPDKKSPHPGPLPEGEGIYKKPLPEGEGIFRNPLSVGEWMGGEIYFIDYSGEIQTSRRKKARTCRMSHIFVFRDKIVLQNG